MLELVGAGQGFKTAQNIIFITGLKYFDWARVPLIVISYVLLLNTDEDDGSTEIPNDKNNTTFLLISLPYTC